MIEQTVEELTPLIGTRPACRALGVAHATIYRRRRPPEHRVPKPRPAPPRALSEPERTGSDGPSATEALRAGAQLCTNPRFAYLSMHDRVRSSGPAEPAKVARANLERP